MPPPPPPPPPLLLTTPPPPLLQVPLSTVTTLVTVLESFGDVIARVETDEPQSNDTNGAGPPVTLILRLSAEVSVIDEPCKSSTVSVPSAFMVAEDAVPPTTVRLT